MLQSGGPHCRLKATDDTCEARDDHIASLRRHQPYARACRTCPPTPLPFCSTKHLLVHMSASLDQAVRLRLRAAEVHQDVCLASEEKDDVKMQQAPTPCSLVAYMENHHSYEGQQHSHCLAMGTRR